MTPVQLAQAALDQAKREEFLQELKKELVTLIEQYEGKCFGSDTFEIRNTSAYKSAIYYERFFIKDDNIYVTEHCISLSHYNNHYKKTLKNVAYDRHIFEKQLTSGEDRSGLRYFYNGPRTPISLQKFNQLWEAGDAAAAIIKTAFSTAVPELYKEH